MRHKNDLFHFTEIPRSIFATKHYLVSKGIQCSGNFQINEIRNLCSSKESQLHGRTVNDSLKQNAAFSL